MKNQITPHSPRPSTEIAAETPPETDANGFDPHDYEWHPMAKMPRGDGWTPRRQREFIEALADTGSVTAAARACRMSRGACYKLRRSPGAERFAAAWDAAMEEASKQLIDIAFDRAINGQEEAIYDSDGNVACTKLRYNDRLLMFLMRQYAHERVGSIGYARRELLPQPVHDDPRFDDEAALAAAPVAGLIQRLEPLVPAEPQKYMHPLDFENFMRDEAEDNLG
jgi:hypothetical protein